jgi:hypothetical protein
MKKITLIIQKEKLVTRFKGSRSMNDVIKKVRDYQINGSFEVHHVLRENGENVTCTISFINENNKIVGEVYPIRYV